jgi:two-component system, OmpR family, response regulator
MQTSRVMHFEMKSSSDGYPESDSLSPRPVLRVLLVEDSPVICGLITEIINEIPGVAVTENVASERDAVDAVARLDVDVVILDLQLRKGTGFGVLRAMRDMPNKPIVVVLTNFALRSYRETALALGAREFLDKSRDYDRLPAILSEIASMRPN